MTGTTAGRTSSSASRPRTRLWPTPGFPSSWTRRQSTGTSAWRRSSVPWTSGTAWRPEKSNTSRPGGENYDGSRLCRFQWVQDLYGQCRSAETDFIWYETGTRLEKDGVEYFMPKKRFQSQQAFYSGLRYFSPVRPVYWLYEPGTDILVPREKLHRPEYLKPHCATCAAQFNCNGCSNCGNCCC